MTDNSREGWIDHDGGPNPIPGQWANIRQRGYADQDDQIWEADFQQWRFKDYDPQPHDIIAYRIVTAADDLGDGNEAEGVVTSKPDELAIAVERATQIAGGRAIGEVYKNHWRIGVSYRSDLRLILSRLASLEETIRADGEALKAADQFMTNGIALGYIRMPDEGTPDPALRTPGIVRARLSARQEGK